MKKIKKIKYLLLNYTGKIKVKTKLLIDSGFNIYSKLSDEVGEMVEPKLIPTDTSLRLLYDDAYGWDYRTNAEFEKQYNENASKLTGKREYGNCVVCKVNSYDVNNLDDWDANHMGSLSKEDVHKIMNIIQR